MKSKFNDILGAVVLLICLLFCISVPPCLLYRFYACSYVITSEYQNCGQALFLTVHIGCYCDPIPNILSDILKAYPNWELVNWSSSERAGGSGYLYLTMKPKTPESQK